ncbi:hypothetical protein H0X06_05660 [Candidatus Dependentiae bacterium]|nr:hypothetical protein [Candidatus Dependentiae bacterium]
MNNVRKLSVFLLLSAGVSNLALAASGCSTDCHTTSSFRNDCSTDCGRSSDCDTDCDTTSDCDRNCSTSFRARPIVGNLTYRNDLTFFNRYHDARCNFFTWDSTYIFEKNRHSKCAGAGLFGINNSNTITVAENGGDINSLFLGLGSNTTAGFSSTITVRPTRRVFSWLSQMVFNLDSCCTGLWADVSFAVTSVRHRLRLTEVSTAGTAVTNDIVGGPTNVTDALTRLGVLPGSNSRCKRTGVDDAMIRLGYDWNYSGNDHVGFYGLGYIPSAKRRRNTSELFQPTVGTRGGGIGFGMTADFTAWSDECNMSDLSIMTELKYTHTLRHRDFRTFDLNNGPLSRFLLVAPQTNPLAPQPLLPLLTSCVKVQTRHTVDWWLGVHYQFCNFGAELDYNLYFRDRERVCNPNIDFGNLGIFDINACSDLTTSSTATVGGAFGSGTTDATFTPLTAADVNVRGAGACRALSSSISGAISYNNVWCDCYPWYLGIGGNVEFASRKHRRSNFENWGVFGKATISF